MTSAIDRLLECPSDTLTVRDASYILGLSIATVARVVNTGSMGSNRFDGRGAGQRMRISIPRASLVRFLVRTSHGDARELLLLELDSKYREMMPFAQMEVDRLAAVSGAAAVPVLRKAGAVKIERPRARRTDESQLSLF